MPNSPKPSQLQTYPVLLKAEDNNGIEVTDSLWRARNLDKLQAEVHAHAAGLAQVQANAQPRAQNSTGLLPCSDFYTPVSLWGMRHSFYKPFSSLKDHSSAAHSHGVNSMLNG